MAKDNKQNHQRFSRSPNPPSPAPKASQPTPSHAAATPTPAPSSSKPVEPQPTPATEQETAERLAAEQQEQEQIPDLSKLPDLTQGIPSTLEYETAGASRSSMTPLEGEEASTSAGGGGGRGKGELPASAYVSSTERNRQWWTRFIIAAMGLSAVGGTVYLGRDWEDNELSQHPEVPNGWGLGLWWNRVRARLGETVTYYQQPAFEKLLPDPDPSFERPYTLCISLEDMLIHSEWTREHGWRVAKRPGVDYFLHYLSQYYEIVLFTSVPFSIAEPVVRKLDPYRFIMWPLYREATKYKDGEVVKVRRPCHPCLHV